MNRPIEFRGVCAKSKEMVYGDLIHGVGYKKGRIYILPHKENLAYVKHCDPLDGVEVIPETVGQFTGLIDRNGNKIFEGDKVVYPSKDCDGQFYKDTYFVYYEKVEFMLCAIKSHIWRKGALIHMHDTERIKIIGTIHD